jgi:hypothetical protein
MSNIFNVTFSEKEMDMVIQSFNEWIIQIRHLDPSEERDERIIELYALKMRLQDIQSIENDINAKPKAVKNNKENINA